MSLSLTKQEEGTASESEEGGGSNASPVSTNTRFPFSTRFKGANIYVGVFETKENRETAQMVVAEWKRNNADGNVQALRAYVSETIRGNGKNSNHVKRFFLREKPRGKSTDTTASRGSRGKQAGTEQHLQEGVSSSSGVGVVVSSIMTILSDNDNGRSKSLVPVQPLEAAATETTLLSEESPQSPIHDDDDNNGYQV